MVPTDEEALIARLRDTFAQNLRPRSEVARLRSDIAYAVNSYVLCEERDEWKIKQVKSPGKEITGLRRRYLDALKSNIEARQCFEEESSRAQRTQQLIPKKNSDSVLPHLELARLRRRQQELETRSRYVHTLREDALHACNLDLRLLKQTNAANANDAENSQDWIAASIATVKTLTIRLQKAVLQANHHLEQQKALLAEVKQIQARSNADINARAKAIGATRNVLVTWIDKKLSENTPHSDSNLNAALGGQDGALSDSPDLKAEQYERYLGVRKALLQAANEALRPLSSSAYPGSTENERVNIKKQSAHSGDMLIVHQVSQRFVPRLQQEADSTALRSYTTTQKAKELQNTIEVLQRLADESNLLAAHPNRREDDLDELTSSVAAWKYAASAATNAAGDEIVQHESLGLEALLEASKWLRQWRSYNCDKEDPNEFDSINWNGIHSQLKDRTSV